MSERLVEAEVVVQRNGGLVPARVRAEVKLRPMGAEPALVTRREWDQADEALLDAFALERVAKMDPHHLAHELQARGVQAVHFFNKGGK